MHSVPTLFDDLPVAVDLDGTLARNDMLHELVAHALVTRPDSLIKCLGTLRQGRAAFKEVLAQRFADHVVEPVWNLDVLDVLRPVDSRRLFLVTGSNQGLAAKAVGGLGLFSEIIGSDSVTNLTGANKGSYLRDRFGERGFIYFGNEKVDLKVWRHAAQAFAVTDDLSLLARIKEVCPHVVHLPLNRRSLVSAFWRSARPHQWVKNTLVFAPLLASHRYGETDLLLNAAAAFALFSFLSSCIYLLNDAADVAHDRHHPIKKDRPIARGDLSALTAVAVGTGGLGLVALGAAVWLPGLFGVVTAYTALALLYSRWFKRVALLDVGVLALLFTLRVWAGGVATGITPSPWLASFSILTFISLALAKRYVELDHHVDIGASPRGRGYQGSDLKKVGGVGIVSMVAAVGVLGGYLGSASVRLLYTHPLYLAGALAAFAFWGARLWHLARKGRLDEDPVLFAIRDPLSWLCLTLLALSYLLAK